VCARAFLDGCVSLYVCVCVGLRQCVHVCAFVQIQMHTRAHCLNPNAHTCTLSQPYTHTHINSHTHKETHLRTHWVCVCVCARMYARVCVCLFLCDFLYLYVQV